MTTSAPKLSQPIVSAGCRNSTNLKRLVEAGISDWLLIYTDKGKGALVVDGTEYMATAGSLNLCSPNTRPILKCGAARKWKFYWATFMPHPTWCDLLDWPKACSGFATACAEGFRTRKRIRAEFRQLVYRISRNHPIYCEWVKNKLEALLIECSTQVVPLDTRRVDVRLMKVWQYLTDHHTEDIILSGLAKLACMSVCNLCRLFKKYFNTTLTQFLEALRLERAKILLQSSRMPIKGIAAAVGFRSPFYFSLQFKRATGASPLEFRKNLTSSHRA